MQETFVMIFAVDEQRAKQIGGEYVCLTGSSQDDESWHVEPTLFDLHKKLSHLPEGLIDWPYVEREIREKGFFKM